MNAILDSIIIQKRNYAKVGEFFNKQLVCPESCLKPCLETDTCMNNINQGNNDTILDIPKDLEEI